MPQSVKSTEDSEPIGIVISCGNRDEPTPAVFAYVWGPAPETDSTSATEATPRAA
jgi:hypothetical protein